jgi:mono/diheme cytochrome c family protein
MQILMKRVLKWIGIGLGSLILLLMLAAGAVYAISEVRFNRTYEIQAAPVEIPTDAEAIAYGEHIASIRGCKACHGENLSGQIEFQDPMVGVIANANLTRGQGSEVSDYTSEDWARSIRHGVGPDGKPLLIMPSNQHYIMSDKDLGALLAYIQSVPAVDNELPELALSLFPRLMYVLGPMDFLVPAELIDHDAPRPPAPEQGATAEYGEYLAGLCSLCHGPGFSGGPIPGTPPEDPPALNLTPAGELAAWTFEDFLRAMRTGVTPSGRQLRDEYMPYQALFGDMSDEEWEAIWLYLQTLAPGEYGNR